MKQMYQMSKREVRQQLNGIQEPLNEKQVLENQEKFGFNELVEGKQKKLWQIFLEQFQDFLVLILIVAAIVSGILGDWESAIVILVVITMNAILGTAQTVKAEQSLQSLKVLSAPTAKVLRGGNIVQIPARELTIGDEVYLEAGDCVPADGRILQSASLKIDESALTGESLPVEKTDEIIEGEVSVGDRVNMVHSGSFVTYGRGSFLVTSIGMDTEVGKIATLLNNASEKRTPLQINLDDFGKKLSITILAFCGLLFLTNVLKGETIGEAFLFAVALAVAAIPEALSSIVTIVLSFGTQKMAKENAIIRKLQAVEGLGSVSVICSDKTGTLTQNKMTVENIYVDSEHAELDDVLKFSVLCNDAHWVDGEDIGDPTETALVRFAIKNGIKIDDVRGKFRRVAEIPFDSDRKLMSTLHVWENEYIMVTKGAVDVLLERMADLGEKERQVFEEKNQEFSKQGLRVLAFAYKKLETARELGVADEQDLIMAGLIAMMDPPREESKAAVEECKRAGIRPIMITGDHKVTAAAIAKRIGILEDELESCEGSAIENMSDEELQEFVERISVYARVSPEHKIRIVRAWQAKGNVVAMTGDGVNDAPALKQADVGVAMGITGSEVSKDASSMILTDDNFATIVKAVENGRNVYKNIKNAIQFLLSGNFGGILVVLFAALLSLPVPFAPVHLLFINLLTDSLPAIALGLEPHSKDVMTRKPRSAKESILTKSFLINIARDGFFVGLVTMIAFYIGYSNGGEMLASTMAFGTLCVTRLVHGFNCKSSRPVIFKDIMWNNKYLIGAFFVGMILITSVLAVPVFQTVFHVVTLSAAQLLIVYALACIQLLIVQFIKWVQERR